MLRASTDSNVTDSNWQHDEHVNKNRDPKELRVILLDDLDKRHCRNVAFFRRTKKGNLID